MRAAGFLCFALAALHAQEPVFRTSTNLQSIAVQVADKHGNLIPGLPASDFTLLEDGHPQKIAFFAAERQPVSLAILLDTSRSMEFGGKLERARAMLAPLLSRTHPQDEIFLMPFTDRAGPFEPVGPDARTQPISVSKVGQGGSALYDAVATALCRMRTASNLRQAIVVLTDGVDEHSRLRLPQLVDLIAASRPQLFAIGLYDKPQYEIFRQGHKTLTIVGLHEIDNPLTAFAQIAKESGAEAFFATSDRELEKAVRNIYALLETQYTLAYYPRAPDRNHKIEVRLKRKGLVVSVRTRVAAYSPALFRSSSCEVSAKEHPYAWESRITYKPSRAMIYHDDFSDAHSGWPNFRFDLATRCTAHYIPDGYEVYRVGSPGVDLQSASEQEIAHASDTAIAAYGPFWSNFRATLQVKMQSFTPGSGAGLVTDVNESGYYALLIANTRKQLAFSFVRGTWHNARVPLVPWTKMTALEGSGPFHRLSVESINGNIRLAIDGQPAGTVHDGNFRAGLAGFGVFGDARARVRDLMVESLP